jgi:hypothetical protein
MPNTPRIEIDERQPLGRLVYAENYTTGWLTAKQARSGAFKASDGHQRAGMLALADEIEKVHGPEDRA